MDEFLFDKGPPQAPSTKDTASESRQPRLRKPVRDQVVMHLESLDELLEPDHMVRVVWAAVCGLDLSNWLEDARAVEGRAGRDRTDPRMLLALWAYATLDGVGSARKLNRLCVKHLAYRWLCGGVTMNYHTLADFRSQGGEKWDELLTQTVASLLSMDLVTMKRVAQDGMRVRANAGKASFRRKKTLEEHLKDAQEQVETLKQQALETPDELSKRERAAQERAAAERAKRIEQALEERQKLEDQRNANAKKSGRKVKEVRASTTDPEARVIQMSDGGYRPAYNVQFSTDTECGIIVGVDVTNAGSDQEQLPPMLEQLRERYGRIPEEALVDGGFASLEAIEKAEASGCTVYAPLKNEAKQLEEGKDPYAKKKGDSKAIAAWRSRMGTQAAKDIYSLRAQIAEWVNAVTRNWGFQQMPVRGKGKCRITALLYAITHNMILGVKLRAELETSS